MIDVPEDRCERHRLFERIDGAFKSGDFDTLAAIFGNDPAWPNQPMPFELGLGHPLEYAIYWSPVALIAELIHAGADVNYHDDGGFPSLIAALSAKRSDRLDIVRLLVDKGADVHQRGVNDWTPLHYAVSLRDGDAILLLLTAGADPSQRTRIDDCSTPGEDAGRIGFSVGIELLDRVTR